MTDLPAKDDIAAIHAFNRRAWNWNVDNQNRWTVPVSPEEVAAARQGDINVILTPKRSLPRSWLAPLRGKDVLLLAGGGGQQAPLLAAYGCKVTVVDIADKQLQRDREVAEREALAIDTICTPAADLSPLSPHSFDAIINPCSNCFFPELASVWRECARVLRPGGELFVGVNNPVIYCFDAERANRGEFILRHKLPYSDTSSMPPAEQQRFLHEQVPLEFSHTLSSQIGDLLRCGFVLCDFFEDEWDSDEPINKYFPQFFVMRARRLAED